MSISSDIGLAIKKEAYEKLSIESNDFLKECADETLSNDEGFLFVLVDMRNWPMDNLHPSDSGSQKLMSDIMALDHEDFRLIEACHDYPDPEGNGLGMWVDNPWGVSQQINVSIYYRDA